MNATWSSLTRTECLKYKGELVGKACDFVPDITLMSFILFFGTYTCSMGLKKFKTSPFFPTTVSKQNQNKKKKKIRVARRIKLRFTARCVC